MSETGKQEEQFKAGQVWLESSTGIMRTITEVLTDGRICYASCYPSADHANKRKLVGPQMECIQDWHDDYRLLTPDAPETDRLTALEGHIDEQDAKIERLREALADIARHPNAVFNVAKCDRSEPTIEQMARAALKEAPDAH
jgi:hypothetical protein